MVRPFRPKRKSFIGARSHRAIIISDELTFLRLVFDAAFGPCFFSALVAQILLEVMSENSF